MEALDSVKFEIIVRDNCIYSIHPDEVAYWLSQPDDFSKKFDKLNDNFVKKHSSMLKTLIDSGSLGAAKEAGTIVDVHDLPETESKTEANKPVEYESEEVLHTADPILSRCPTEEPDITMLGGTSGSTYLITKKNPRTLARHTMLGGHGTGKYFPSSDSKEGVEFEWPQGDQSYLLVDQSGLKESTLVTPETLYKYLVILEKTKRVTEYKVTYSDITRKTGSQTDGFDVKLSANMKYCAHMVGNKAPPLSCKNWFAPDSDYFAKFKESEFMTSLFRFKFERVCSTSKVQKPYAVTTTPLTLTPGKPVKV